MNRTRKIVRQWIAGALAVTMLSAAMAAPAFAAPEGTESTASETTATVADWSWTDAASLTWQEDTQSWLLSLTEDQTLSGTDDLKALLPHTVDAKVTEAAVDTAETADASLELTWDTSALTFPLEGGDYTVTASLPEGYALAEGVPAPAVTVQVPGDKGNTTGDTQLPPATNSIQRAPQANRPSLLAENTPDTVDTVDPVGTTINLFDYSVKDNDMYAPDNTFATGHLGSWYFDYGDLITGINKNHILKFSKDSDDLPVQGGNKYDEKKDRYPGIVADVLGEDHFPKLSDDAQKSWAGTGNNEKLTPNESLAYLFDPASADTKYRKSYTNVKGLLKVENGYYTYDSGQNYACLDQDQNRFTVYDGVPDKAAYFFPFDEFGEVTKNDDPKANHYFGMTMTTRFVQQNGGKTTDGTDTPITYEFAGDDDVWVFIDGVLVGDIGGIHGQTSLKIDFSTGEIWVNGEPDKTLLEKFNTAGQHDKTSWKGNTFADKTYHTLQFFYLERGNYASNLFLKFNMESVSESSINNVDQDGYGKSGLTFSLYATGDDYNVSASTPVYTGTTEANGVLNMVDESGNNVKLSNLRDNYPNGYFVLREINPPAGYRSLGDVHLKFMENSNLDILLAANPWDSGAYATPTVTATLPQYVYADGDTTNTRIDTQDQDTLKGTFFAVVLKRNAAGDNNTNDWLPVYGDAMTGWQVEADSSWNSVLEAAQKNPYLFAVDNTGLRTTIENLPGDLAKYYYILQQNKDDDPAGNAEYTVAYYYTEASSLDRATQDNTKRLDTERTAQNEEIQREFSVRVYVPNVKNYLIVQGVAKDGTTALSGATFDLYTADQVTGANGSYTINTGEQPYDTVITENMNQDDGDSITAQGAGIFPSDSSHVLAAGTYYLKERTTPEGYEPSDQIVKVIVDNTGVYADAGEQNDDVTVLRGAGKIVRSMLQFAVPDAINTTLADITATLNTLPEGKDPSTSRDWTSTNQTMDLSYHASDVPLEYGLSDSEGDPYFVVDEGWSHVTIKQNYNNGQLAHNEAGVPNAGPKEPVTNDLTNLFSRSTIVRMESDVQLCTLTISNKVNAPVGNDSNQSFTINVTLTDGQDNPLNDSYSYSGGKLQDQEFAGVQEPEDGTLNLSSGTGTVSLTSGQTVTIEDIPYWSKFTVTETGADNYNKSYQATVSDVSPHAESSASGTMQGNTTVAITNTRIAVGSVSLTQNVSGPMGSYTDAFTYTLQLYDNAASGGQLNIDGTYQATLKPATGDEQTVQITFAGGQATQMTPVKTDGSQAQPENIALANGATLTISGLPAGAVFEAAENEANANGYTTQATVDATETNKATVPNNATTSQTITFTNTRAAITPTGLREENNPYIAMVGLAGVAALLAAGGWVRTRRRRREED